MPWSPPWRAAQGSDVSSVLRSKAAFRTLWAFASRFMEQSFLRSAQESKPRSFPEVCRKPQTDGLAWKKSMDVAFIHPILKACKFWIWTLNNPNKPLVAATWLPNPIINSTSSSFGSWVKLINLSVQSGDVFVLGLASILNAWHTMQRYQSYTSLGLSAHRHQ